MRHTRITTLALAVVAACAISVIASATASALPLHPELVNGKGETLAKNKFTSVSGKATLETVKGEKITCKEDTDKGETTGVSSSTSTVNLKGCESAGIKCNTSGGAAGEIVLKAKAKLVWIKESTEAVGLLLETEPVTVKCSILETIKVEGTAIGAFSGKGTTFTLALTQSSKGIQEPLEYEEGGKKVKPAVTMSTGTGAKKFGPEESSLQTTDTLTFEEPAELR